MKYNPDIHHRHSIRLKGYDYTQAGAYFITICTQNRACLFGNVMDGVMRLNEFGEIARQCWSEIPAHFPNAILDEYVVMPNHIHGIIVLVDSVGATHASPLATGLCVSQRPSIASIVGSFKSAVTKHINHRRSAPGESIWQRNYYEHIIRNLSSLERIRKYIINNPLQWALDCENPAKQNSLSENNGISFGGQSRKCIAPVAVDYYAKDSVISRASQDNVVETPAFFGAIGRRKC